MIQVIHDPNEQNIPIKMWLSYIEDGALQQAKNLTKLPFAHRHVAIMADAHEGFGMPIGGVLAVRDVVIPNAVGVDIGCGVRAVKTNISVKDFMPLREKVLNHIQRNVPTGFNHHTKPQEPFGDKELFDKAPNVQIIRQELESARRQLGTLGGGNHFIEVQKDGDNVIWLMLHSGSRNLGKKVADVFNKKAIALNEKWNSPVTKDMQLAYLPFNSEEGREYWDAMNFCMEFARENRLKLLAAMIEAFQAFFPSFRYETPVDIHHNYAAQEQHFGESVVIHRKGAVRAVGEVIIPGSMGSNSYICRGLENEESFMSCSHGAGRTMGRKQAIRQIPVECVIQEMKDRDICLFKPKKHDVAEECRQAYKCIDEVMENQKDLVVPLVKLTPLGVIKA